MALAPSSSPSPCCHILWHSESLHLSRIALDGLIKEHRKTGKPIPSFSEFENAPDELEKHAFRIFHFFERWALLARAKYVDRDLLAGVLGHYAGWWQEEFFAPIQAREQDSGISDTLTLIKRELFDDINTRLKSKS